MRQRLIYLFSAFSIFNASGQTLFEIEKAKNDSILFQFQEKDDLKYLALLPTVGYDALNNSFTIGINISQFSNYLQTRRRNRIEIAQLETLLNTRSLEKIEKINAREEKYLIDYQQFKLHLISLQIQEQLFEISIGKYKSNEISTEQFLSSKLSFTNTVFGYLNQISRLIIEARILDSLLNQSFYHDIAQQAKENLLQRGKKLGVLGAEPLSVMLIK
jgi:hypothetical protein